MRKLIILIAVSCAWQWGVAQPPGAAGQHQNRAASLLLAQEYEPALRELEQAAALYRDSQNWGQYFACLNQITQAQIDLGRLTAAKRTAKKALWQSIETLGRNNDEAAKASHKLGQVYEAAGRYEDAMQCHNIAHDIREDLFTQQHPKAAESLVYMAITARYQQAYDLAGHYLEEAAASLQQYYQKDHPELATVLEQKGLLCLAAGQAREARASFQRAVEILGKFPNQFPAELGRNLCHLADLSEASEKQALYEKANQVFRMHQLFGEPAAVKAAQQLAEWSLSEGQIFRAQRFLKQALRAGGPQTEIHRLMAEVHYALGAFAEATRYYEGWLHYKEATPHPAAELRACKAALFAGKPGLALQWANHLMDTKAQSALQPDAILISAKALARQGAVSAAERRINELVEAKDSPARAEALAFKAEQLLQQHQYDDALQHLRASHASAGQAKLTRQSALAALARLHTMLASQDRNTLDNLEAATGYLEEFTAMAFNRLQYPLGPESARWFTENLALVYEAALQCSYLMAQYEPDSRADELAFKWMESAKVLTALLEEQRQDTSAIFWRYQLANLGISAELQTEAVGPGWRQNWERDRHPNQAKLRYRLPRLRSLYDFRTTLSEPEGVAFHYYSTGTSLFVLRVSQTELQLYKNSLAEGSWPLNASAGPAEAGKLLFPGLDDMAGQTKQILVFPPDELLGYPFPAVEIAGAPLGARLPVYLHFCASTLMADLENQAHLPAPGGSLLWIQHDEAAADAGSVAAMPTSKQDFPDCASVLRKWVEQQPEGEVASLLPDSKISLGVLKAQALPRLSRQLREQPGLIRHLWIQSSGKISAQNGLLYTLLQLQQQHVGLIRMQYGGCDSTGFEDWVEKAWQTANPIRALQPLEAAKPGQSTGFFFGAPINTPGRAPSNIPVFWILAGVAGMILTGLWVRR